MRINVSEKHKAVRLSCALSLSLSWQVFLFRNRCYLNLERALTVDVEVVGSLDPCRLDTVPACAWALSCHSISSNSIQLYCMRCEGREP